MLFPSPPARDTAVLELSPVAPSPSSPPTARVGSQSNTIISPTLASNLEYNSFPSSGIRQSNVTYLIGFLFPETCIVTCNPC